ncbi:L-lactate permease [Fundidesulfovibrio magnetotacticus]|uniref:L-lactate permease n=1 Tax=Fundidesulfovibrio magnetotacticus TaxID=2730080 RepID=A0A6V8LTN0_9BACT|nr:lactate permease LctP family transporter [Fundidesulfovibrio magnetotacticus]GFK95822.1 L-lactate permease [Fundidesulfovibrio magnetotacticus]
MSAWLQVYKPLGDSYVMSALVAGIPIYILFYMLAVKRAKGHVAGAVASLAALVLGIVFWGIPASTAIGSYTYGFVYGLFPIVWIVVTAVWVYNMTVESGEFEIIKNSLATITDDRRLQAVFVGFAFGSFIEGTAGFGTPVAITAAMLAGLGFNPLYAAGICLLANTAPVAFGAVGIPITAVAGATKLDELVLSQIVGRQLPFLSVIVPIWLSVTMCGFKRTMEVLPALLVAGVAFAGTQFLMSNFHGPTLPDILSAIVTIIALWAFLRVWKPKTTFHFADEAPSTGKATSNYSAGEILRAWMPYLILAVLVLIQGWPSIKKILAAAINIQIEWPLYHNMVAKMVNNVATPQAVKYAFQPLAAAGTAILLSGLLSVFIMPGYTMGKAIACFGKTCNQLRWPIISIGNIVGLAFIMNANGMSTSLGMALAGTGVMFPFFAPILGWLGVFLTGSDTSSNLLFGNLQKTTALEIGVRPELCVAANTSGGVTGKMISPQSISVAVAATGLHGKDGDIFRFTLWHSVAMVLFVSCLTMLMAYPLKWMLPG